tara:strand:+ start:51 stop:686 length:636 start_codon:yes stop_codon:yes gene_type:complete
MERGRKNRVKSKFNMKSPFRQAAIDIEEEASPDWWQDETGANRTDLTESEKDVRKRTMDKAQGTSDFLDWKKNINQAEYDKFKQMTNTTSESTDPVEPVEEKGIDRWIDKPIMEVLGLTKKQREARKAKKAQRIEDAKKAESEGTETLKQAKLVKRAKKRENRLAKKAIKDKQKLAKWREKNPVTGKEAINKLAIETGGTPIAKYKKGYGV